MIFSLTVATAERYRAEHLRNNPDYPQVRLRFFCYFIIALHKQTTSYAKVYSRKRHIDAESRRFIGANLQYQ